MHSERERAIYHNSNVVPQKKTENKVGVKSEMSSTQQYSLNFMNIPLNDDNNGECTIGKMYLQHLQYVKEIN